ncbi:MAG: MFS transporter [Chloroflexi bacterium]|nr:MAG: MFS transporter [Chloroflexota bacterium]
MFALLRRRDFALVWTASLISATGDWVLFIGLPIYVYQLTGSTLATSAMFVAELVPQIALGSVAGVFVDRWDRKRTMVVANLVLTVALLPLAFVRSADLVWIVYVVAFTESLLARFLRPAEAAMLPRLVEKRDLVAANSLGAFAANTARLVGPTVGGIVAGLYGLGAVAAVDSATFLIAAVLVTVVRTSGAPDRAGIVDVSAVAAGRMRACWHEWVDGLALVTRSRTIRVLFGLAALSSLGEGSFGVLFVVWVNRVIGGTALELGWFMTAQAVGGLVGGLVIVRITRGMSPRQVLGVASVAFGLLDALLFVSPLIRPEIVVSLVVIGIVGIAGVAFMAGFNAILQTSVDDAYRGRVFGAIFATMAVLRLASTVIAGVLGGIVSPIPLLIAMQSGSYVVLGLAALGLLPREAGRERENLLREPA